MFIIIRHMTKAYGIFKDEESAQQYGMAHWVDTNFSVLPLAEALEDIGITFEEV